jgi:hypothetical protein
MLGLGLAPQHLGPHLGKPYTVGPAGVAEYYAAQPMGMTAAYMLRETAR